MREVIGEVLTPAIGVALSPLPIVGVILMLLSQKARVNGPAFVLGWLAGMALVMAIVQLLIKPDDRNDAQEAPSTLAGVIFLGLGVLLLVLAVKQWRSRPKASEVPDLPKWMDGIDKISPMAAFGLGAFMSGLNPKNLIFDISDATSISAADLNTGDQVIAPLVFMAIASISVAGPVIWYLAAGESATGTLNSLRGRLV